MITFVLRMMMTPGASIFITQTWIREIYGITGAPLSPEMVSVASVNESAGFCL